MSKNKAFNFVGVYLPKDVFVHEQLCVANRRIMSLSVVVVYVEAYQGNVANAAQAGSSSKPQSWGKDPVINPFS